LPLACHAYGLWHKKIDRARDAVRVVMHVTAKRTGHLRPRAALEKRAVALEVHAGEVATVATRTVLSRSSGIVSPARQLETAL
jgi:hypothetical protein